MSTAPDPNLSVTTPFPGLTLLLGGARSGKSSFAVRLGESWVGPVVFVATARTDHDDADLLARVQRHQAERPPAWSTVEPPVDVITAVRAAPADALVIVDCVTLWVAGAFDDPTQVPEVERAAAVLADVAASRDSPSVVVSNEVGLGLHPMSDLGRAYRDTLGRVNTALAARARRTLFLVAGRAVRLDDPWDLLA